MEAFLYYLDSFCPLSRPLRDDIAALGTVRSIARKAFLFKAGGILGECHYILSGLVRVFRMIPGGAEANKWFFLEGDMIAYRQSFDRQQPCEESYQALEDTEVVSYPIHMMDVLCNQYPEFWRHRAIITSKFASAFYNAPDVLRKLPAPTKYNLLKKNYPRFVERVPDKHLASFIDVHESTLSKLRSAR